jgi:ATP-dependent Clp protease ATP-binding subunit ClpA
MLSKELEFTLNHAFKEAREKRHEYMTVEHLLLCLLDNPTAAKVLRACGADGEKLRGDIATFIEETTPLIAEGDARETQPTLGFQRVLQRAVFHVQSAGKKEVTGANVLVALFSEQDSQAVYLLNQQDVSRLDVVNYISHGISKVPGEEQDDDAQGSRGAAAGGEGSSSALDNFASNLNELARQGRIDPLIGRAGEVERTAQILCRRRKNNPLLVGEAGVGKTAIAEGLAKKIVDGEVPEVLERRRHLRARPGLPGGGHQVSRRLREAPQGRAGRAEAQAACDPVHRRDSHHHRCRRGLRRRHGRVQPDQARAGLR